MNDSKFDALLPEIGNSIRRLARELTSAPKLIVAFAVTLALLLVGLVAVNVVLPVILVVIGGLILFKYSKDISRKRNFFNRREDIQKDFEAVYLQTLCADLIQSMGRAGASWSFDKMTHHLSGEGADFKTALEACVELEWLEPEYEHRLVTATKKGMTESRRYLTWARINK